MSFLLKDACIVTDLCFCS